MYDPSTKHQTKFFGTHLETIWDVLGQLEAEEASGRHLEVRSQKLQSLSAKMQKWYTNDNLT